MKELTNDQKLLNKHIEDTYNNNKTEFTTKDDYFSFLAISNILKDKDLSDEEIEEGITDGGGDGGCDGIYLFIDDNVFYDPPSNADTYHKGVFIELHIIQTKNTPSFAESVLEKWKTLSARVFDIGQNFDNLKQTYNCSVLSAFEAFRKVYVDTLTKSPSVSIFFHYITRAAEIHQNLTMQAQELEKQIKNLYPTNSTRVKVKLWRAVDLLNAIQRQKEERLELTLADNAINTGEKKDYVALVNLHEFYHFLTTPTGELKKYIFESNVRDFLGQNSVNEAISQTLQHPNGEDFWWLNNGITIVAEDATPFTNKKLVLTNPSIVNGLQTSYEIYQHFNNNKTSPFTEKRNILIRVIVPENETSRDNIILATNNQTSIQKSSLRANDRIHWTIEQYFKTKSLFYDRRKNFYKNIGKKASDIVSIQFLSQCMISLLLQRPNDARARPSSLLVKDDVYNRIFDDSIAVEAFYFAANLGKTIAKVLRKETSYTKSEINDLLFYVLYYSVANNVRNTTITKRNLKELKIESFTHKYILTCAEKVYDIYRNQGGNSQVAKGGSLIKSLCQYLQTKFSKSVTVK